MEKGQSYPLIRFHGQGGIPILRRLPANSVTDQGLSAGPASIVAGRVMVIAGSFPESRDIYQTPLGPMPGAMVLVNAVQSLIRFGSITNPSLPTQLTLMAGLIVITTAVDILVSRWLRLNPVLLDFVFTTTLIVFWYIVSSLYFKAGIWIDSVVPLYTIALYFSYSEFEEMRRERDELQEKLSGISTAARASADGATEDAC